MDDQARAAAEPVEKDWEWAIVEIFGHRRHVGKAREEERFGSKMLRIDVPTLGAATGETTWATHYYGGASIFSFTLTDEKTVMRAAERAREYTPAIPYRDHGTDEEQEGFEFEEEDDDAP